MNHHPTTLIVGWERIADRSGCRNWRQAIHLADTGRLRVFKIGRSVATTEQTLTEDIERMQATAGLKAAAA